MSKFEKVGDIWQDNTLKNGNSNTNKILRILFEKLFSAMVYDRIHPVCYQHLRIYQLPKIHQVSVPLRYFLSIVGSNQHELAKWLIDTLNPVLKNYSVHCILDFFQFAALIHALKPSSDTEYLCSFDISSLFTNIPLDETIDICVDMLYWSLLNPPLFL